MKAGKIKQKKERTMADNASITKESEQSVAERKGKPLWKRAWFLLCFGSGIFLLLFTFILPLGTKYYAIDWLRKHGADQAVIDRLGWNPFAGRLWINGVDLSQGGKTVMKQGTFDINIDYASLFTKDIALSSAHYTGLLLEVEQKKDGSWQIATLAVPSSTEKNEPAKEEKEKEAVVAAGSGEDAGEKARKAWAFLADNVSIKDCQIHYITPVFDFTLAIDSAELKRFSTREGGPVGSLVLKGQVNGKPVYIDLKRIKIAPELHLTGRVEAEEFDLDSLDALLQASLPYFAGDASLAGDIDFSLGDRGMDVDYNGSLSIAKVDVGAESFRTGADRLAWKGKIRYEMPADAAARVVTDGVLEGEKYHLQLPASKLKNSEQLIKLSGVTTVTLGDTLLVEQRGKLVVNDVFLTLPELQTTEKSLLWDGLVQYSLNKEQHVEVKGSLAVDAVGVESGSAAEKVSAMVRILGWKGAFSFLQPENGSSSIQTDSTLSGEDTKITLQGGALLLSEKSITLASKSELQLGDELHLQSRTSFTAGKFTFQQSEAKEPMLVFDRLVVNDFAGLGGKKIDVGSVVAANLSLKMEGDFPLDIDVADIRLTGFSTADLENFAVASLVLAEPRIVSLHNGKDVLVVKDIRLDSVAADTDGKAAVGAISLNNASFLGDKKSGDGVALGQARLNDIRWSKQDGFAGDNLEFKDLSTTIIRDADGEINLVKQITAMQKKSAVIGGKEVLAQKKTADSNKTESLPLKLGKVCIAGENLIRFEDQTLKVPYKANLKIDDFEIRELDSHSPEHKSPLKLLATLEERAPLSIKGSLQPFLQDIGVDLSLKVKNYPLKNLSPYTIQSIGVGLASGELRVDSSFSLSKKYIKNTNKLLLKKLETKTISHTLAKELDNRLPIPLDAALSLLRNKNNDIELSVPLNGKLDDLHVGLADVIVTALEKAVVPALTGYAVYALGPYGALAYAGMKLGEDLLKEKDLPLLFMPGDTALVEQQKKVLDPIGKKMQAGDGDMNICPIVASWELMSKKQIEAVAGDVVPLAGLSAEMQQNLNELGQSRAKNIQQYLGEKFNIAKNRLLLCTTVIKEEKKMLPLVALRGE